MTTLRAHFDGRVLVPDEPVHLPTGTPLELQVTELHGADETRLHIEKHPLTGLPVVRVPPGTKIFTLEDVQRAEADEL